MLGPLEVRDPDGASIPVTGARLRTLLIQLALAPSKLVPLAQLVDAVWGDQPPAGAGNALQALVSRLRRALPDAVVESRPAGYRLLIDRDTVDVTQFERLITEVRGSASQRPPSGPPVPCARRSACGAVRCCSTSPRWSSSNQCAPGWKSSGWPPSRTASRQTCSSAAVPSWSPS